MWMLKCTFYKTAGAYLLKEYCSWFSPRPAKVLCPYCFFGNLILRFCFRAIVNENKKAVIVEGRLVSSHIPLRPKHWFAINAIDFAPVVGHLRFGGSVFVRISAATTRQQPQHAMSKTCQTWKGRLQTPSTHRICPPFAYSIVEATYQCRNPQSLQGCCGCVDTCRKFVVKWFFVKILFQRWWVGLLDWGARTLSQASTHVRSCVPAKRGFQRTTTSLPKLVVTKMGD